jgi:hypothetical protein
VIGVLLTMTLISLAAAGVASIARLAGAAAIMSARPADVRPFLIENISFVSCPRLL